MAMAKNYTVTVKTEAGAQASKASIDSSAAAQTTPDDERVKSQLLANVAVQMGRSALNYGLSNFGSLTGDYQMQSSMQAVSGVAMDVMMIARGGPLGIAAVGIKVASNAITQLVDMTKADHQAELLRRRVGLETSRGR